MRMLIIPLLLLTGACSATSQAVIEGATEKLEQAGDKRLELQENGVCRTVTVRAIMKRYNSRDQLEKWAQFCGYTQDTSPVMPLPKN